MAKKKSKEYLLAEIAYVAGRKDAIENAFQGDEEAIVEIGVKAALADWKEQTGGKKPEPTVFEYAHKKWTAEGCPPTGTWFGGALYRFDPDGTFLLTETFYDNFLSEKE